MTRPRLGRAERARIAERRTAAAEDRQMTMIERDVATLERLARTLLLTQIAYSQGKIPQARYEAIGDRLRRELDAMRDARKAVTALDGYEPPAMKS